MQKRHTACMHGFSSGLKSDPILPQNTPLFNIFTENCMIWQNERSGFGGRDGGGLGVMGGSRGRRGLGCGGWVGGEGGGSCTTTTTTRIWLHKAVQTSSRSAQKWKFGGCPSLLATPRSQITSVTSLTPYMIVPTSPKNCKHTQEQMSYEYLFPLFAQDFTDPPPPKKRSSALGGDFQPSRTRQQWFFCCFYFEQN